MVANGTSPVVGIVGWLTIGVLAVDEEARHCRHRQPQPHSMRRAPPVSPPHLRPRRRPRRSPPLRHRKPTADQGRHRRSTKGRRQTPREGTTVVPEEGGGAPVGRRRRLHRGQAALHGAAALKHGGGRGQGSRRRKGQEAAALGHGASGDGYRNQGGTALLLFLIWADHDSWAKRSPQQAYCLPLTCNFTFRPQIFIYLHALVYSTLHV